MVSFFLLLLAVLTFGDDPPHETRIPIYRYWAGSISDHFYTASSSELGLSGNGAYNYEGIGFYLSQNQCDASTPLYRYYQGSVYDHFYTTSSSEIGTISVGSSGNYGYVYEGIIGYCYPESKDDTVALYRYYQPSVYDHFYTIYSSEIGTGLSAGDTGKYGYVYEGIQCYVYAAATNKLDEEMKQDPSNLNKINNQLFTDTMPVHVVNNHSIFDNYNMNVVASFIAVLLLVVISVIIIYYKRKNNKSQGYELLV